MLKYEKERQIIKTGYCEVCDNLVWVSESCAKCKASNKLIIPEFPPYNKINSTCQEFKSR